MRKRKHNSSQTTRRRGKISRLKRRDLPILFKKMPFRRAVDRTGPYGPQSAVQSGFFARGRNKNNTHWVATLCVVRIPS